MRKIFFRNILKNKTILVVAFCAFLLIATFANLLRNNYIQQNPSIEKLPPPPQTPAPNQPQVQIIHHTLARVTTLPPSPQLQPPKLDPRNYLQKNPSLLSCSKEYSKWQSSEETTSPVAAAQSFDYAKPSPTSTHSLRILRAVLVYFPIESLEHFKLEFKWLYRSWIEMQKYEPKQWRTDLIVFIENDKKIFADENLFFNKLKCEFTNLRMSDTDAPMCTLIDFKPLQKRENVGSGPAAIKKSYEAILDETKIFQDDRYFFLMSFIFYRSRFVLFAKGHQPKIFCFFFPGINFTIWAPIMIAQTICNLNAGDIIFISFIFVEKFKFYGNTSNFTILGKIIFFTLRLGISSPKLACLYSQMCKKIIRRRNVINICI
jgi:hypothetical protein